MNGFVGHRPRHRRQPSLGHVPGSSGVKASSTSFAITVAKAASRTKATAKPAGRTVRLAATVVAPAGARAGKVVVRDRGRWVGVITTPADGTGSLVVRTVRPGRHRYVLTSRGNANAQASRDAVAVRVRR